MNPKKFYIYNFCSSENVEELAAIMIFRPYTNTAHLSTFLRSLIQNIRLRVQVTFFVSANVVIKREIETQQFLPFSYVARIDDVAILFAFLKGMKSMHSLFYHIFYIADLHWGVICIVKFVIPFFSAAIPRPINQLIQLFKSIPTFFARFQSLLFQMIPSKVYFHMVQLCWILSCEVSFGPKTAEAEPFVALFFEVTAFEIDQL